MEKIKDVYFCSVNEFEKSKMNGVFVGRNFNFLGAVKTYNCGLSLSTYGNNNYDYIPLWIVDAIVRFLEKQRKKLSKDNKLPNRDYIFYVKQSGKDCVVAYMKLVPTIA